MSKIIITFIIIILFSCEFDTNNSSDIVINSKIQVVDSVSFKTGMSVRGKHSGTFIDKNNDRELFYFSNVLTSKSLKIYTRNGDLINEIQLDTVLTKCKAIQGLSIISLDTIVILSQYTNKLFFLNKEGLIFKRLYLDEIIQKGSDDSFEFFTSVTGAFILNDSTFVFKAYWIRNNNEDLSNLSHFEHLEIYMKTYWTKPNLLIVNNVFNEPTFVLKYNIYPHIIEEVDSSSFFGELAYYNFAANNILSWSTFSNKLLFLDSKTNILKKVEINSSEFEINMPYEKLTRENVDGLNDALNDNKRSSTLLSCVFYSKNEKIYYIKIRKEVPSNWFDENNYRPWLLLVYDENFNKLDEISFDKKETSGMVLMSEQGLMIEEKQEIKDFKNQEIKFKVYNYEK